MNYAARFQRGAEGEYFPALYIAIVARVARRRVGPQIEELIEVLASRPSGAGMRTWTRGQGRSPPLSRTVTGPARRPCTSNLNRFQRAYS